MRSPMLAAALTKNETVNLAVGATRNRYAYHCQRIRV